MSLHQQKNMLQKTLTFLVIILTTVIFWRIFTPKVTQASWIYSDYLYRAPLTFTHNADIASPRRLSITVNTSTLISAGKMQSDCDDTRFTNEAQQKLRYQLISGCNTSSTAYDVELLSIVNGTNTLYLYYGNNSATSESTDISTVTSLSPSGGSPSSGSEESAIIPTLAYSLDEGYGTIAQDTTQQNRDGTVSGALWRTEDLCVSGKCLYFDGSNDAVTTSGTTSNVRTVSFWVRPTTTTEQLVDINGTASISTSSGTISATSFTSPTIYVDGKVSSTLVANRWQHVVVTTSTGLSASALRLGQISTNYGQMFMDEFQLYTSALSESQVKSLYNARGGNLTITQQGAYNQKSLSDGLVGYWKMDETSGNTSDYSGNNNTLVNNGTTTYLTGKYGSGSEHIPASSQHFTVGGTQVDTYYFDASDAGPTDVSAAWNNDANAFDGSTSTYADTNTEFASLIAEGTNAPGSGGTISQVRARSYISTAGFGGNCIMETNIYRNGGVTLLGTLIEYGGPMWGAYNTLTAPGGGWNWAEVQALEKNSNIYADSGSCNFGNLYSVEVEVTSNTTVTLNNLQTISFWVNPDSTTNNYINLTSSANITSTSGTLTTTGISNPRIYINGTETTNVAADQWQHITITTDTPINADQFYAGRVGSNYFDGTLDEIKLYSRTLSSSEVQQLYNWTPGPVGHWKLDENTGISAYDISTNDNTLTLTNTPRWVQGKYGAGIIFSGSNQHLTRADDADFDYADDASITLSTWFKHAPATTQEIILSKYNEAGYKIIMESDGDITCALDYDATWTPTDSATSTAASYDDNQWHHLSCVKTTDTRLDLYIDGILVASDTSLTATNTLTNTDPIYIGIDDDGTSNDFTGILDDIRIYNYARTPSQIIQDMNAGHPLVGTPVAGPVAHWKFDEGYGTTANDQTPNANNLTLSTATSSWTNNGKYGKAWDGNGTRYTSRANDNDFDVGTSDFAISLWFRSDNTGGSGTQYILNRASSTTQGFAIYGNSSGNIVFAVDDDTSWTPDATVTSTANLYDQTWHHIVATKTGTSRIDLYVDGKLNASTTTSIPTGSLSNDLTFYLADRDGIDNGDEFIGDLDEVKIYTATLTLSDVQTEYNQGKSLVLGATGTTSTGLPDNSSSREYCVPGDSSTCNPPIAEWKFDENTGTTANDSSGTANTGTLTGGAIWTTAKNGQAVSFDGVDDRITTTNIFNTSQPFTFSSWVYPRATNNNDTIFSFNGASQVMYFGTTGQLRLCNSGSCSNEAVSNSSLLALNKWSHLAVTYDGNAQFFVDGINRTSTTAVDDENANAAIILAYFTNNNALDGKLDQTRWYNYARTSAQIAWEFNHGAPIAWWKLDETSGTTAYDASQNGNGDSNNSTGTLNNTPTRLTTAKFNGGIDFDGSNDNISIPNNTRIDQNDALAQGLAFSFWVYPQSDGETDVGRIFEKNTGTYCRTTNDDATFVDLECSLDLATDATLTVTDALRLNQWSHVTLGWSNDADDEFTIWVNGINRGASTNGVGDASADTALLYLGGNTTNFDGYLDEFKIFNFEPTLKQVQNIYNEGSAVKW